MNKVFGIIVLISGLALTGCGGSSNKVEHKEPKATTQQAPQKAPEAPREQETRPGNPEVYKRISKLTDCNKLQEEFDTADAAGNRARDNGQLDQAAISTEYMKAAFDRQNDLKCFG